MKTKTDLYTKVVLTAIAIFLGIIIVKDIDFVSKAQAGEVINLSEFKTENLENEETTFYIYENDKLFSGFGKTEYPRTRYSNSSVMIKKDVNQAYIEEKYDFPQYIITTKTGTFWLKK